MSQVCTAGGPWVKLFCELIKRFAIHYQEKNGNMTKLASCVHYSNRHNKLVKVALAHSYTINQSGSMFLG